MKRFGTAILTVALIASTVSNSVQAHPRARRNRGHRVVAIAQPLTNPQPIPQQVMVAPVQQSVHQATVYSASWCGACHEAIGFLRSRGVFVTERDVDQPDVRAELETLARTAGVRVNAVPMIILDGVVFRGFDRGQLDQRLAQR